MSLKLIIHHPFTSQEHRMTYTHFVIMIGVYMGKIIKLHTAPLLGGNNIATIIDIGSFIVIWIKS